jgi:murein DD-endopeptidase MepM/ murein hydrolase activator NlpD
MRNYSCKSHINMAVLAVGAFVLPFAVSGLEKNEAFADNYSHGGGSGNGSVGGFVVQGAEVPIEKDNLIFIPKVVWPVDDPVVSSGFGWRKAPCSVCSENHKGVDFTPGEGTPVYAAMRGVVVEMGYKGGYGVYVVLEHDFFGDIDNAPVPMRTVYAHLERDSFPRGLALGVEVKAGEVLGSVGQTGVSTGPHLHFELIVRGRAVNPYPFLLEKINMREHAEKLGSDIVTE